MTTAFKPQLTAVLPAGWFVKESITLLAPDGQANVIASSEPLDASIDTEQYANVQGQLLRREFQGYRELAFGRISLFGGREGYMRRFEWDPRDTGPISQMQIYYVENERGYTATATTPSTQIERFELLLRQILGGLRIEGSVSELHGAPTAAPDGTR